ncbi:hypothetical protein NL676_012238 [Syzygium grande]|nr:hypothetical protein NL676_012238 [Syzygium grande]
MVNEEEASAPTEWRTAMERVFHKMDKEVIAWNEGIVAVHKRCRTEEAWARVASRRATRSNWWRSAAAATAIASTATTTTLSTIINIFDGCVESVTNGLSSYDN